MLRVLKIYFKIYNDIEESRGKVHNKNLKSALFIKKSTIHNKNLKSTLFTNLISLRLRRRDKICDSSKITILLQSHRVPEGLFCSWIELLWDMSIWTASLTVLTALCDAITIVTVFFVWQIRPLLENYWLMLLRSSFILYSALPTSLELKWIWVSSVISATSELWHALDMLLMWILNKVAPNTIPLRDFKREMPKSQNQSLGKSRCAY